MADDSLTIQKVINLTFVDEGIDVTTVGDGDSAIRSITESRPDILLADVHMPGPSGYEICSLIRQFEETANIPVILLVGSFEQFDPAEADRVGANAYVTKPFQSIRQLVDQVKSLISKADDGLSTHEQQHDREPAEAKADEGDMSDIESLYHQSFAETVEMPAEMAAAAGLAGDRMADDIVETSYAAEQYREPYGFNDTLPSDRDFDDVGTVAQPGFVGEGTEVVSLDEDFREPVYDDLPAVEIVEFATDDVQVAEQLHTAETEEFTREVRDPFESTAENFELDEIDLLDLDPHASDRQFMFTTPSIAAEQDNKAQVVSLSPELLDVIVQKVVEKLSEKY